MDTPARDCTIEETSLSRKYVWFHFWEKTDEIEHDANVTYWDDYPDMGDFFYL
ncbi:hypothetical protein LZF95_06160 [Algoriphagus sp. AGSA1]|uniref:hypothetical protein n=1 Tax=Algoriphagus sp. AGSA1 TaxID=2907213 RepID=UPI001F3BE45A|nr:hypothetical protein [Algoriphagus sp. AGSA1]MCE7054252.1 hypothetical protein [Algoriphagus sp. AGSA1]